MDEPAVFGEALKGEGLLLQGFNVEVLEVAGMLSEQIAAGRPYGEAQEAGGGLAGGQAHADVKQLGLRAWGYSNFNAGGRGHRRGALKQARGVLTLSPA